MVTKIPAFLDGNTFVHYSPSSQRLLAANSGGLIKVFASGDTASEPVAVDIPENLTSISTTADKVVVTSTDGQLALLTLGATVSGDESYDVVYQANNPLRDAVFINEGNRILCGGDSANLVVIDLKNGSRIHKVPVADKILRISYNPVGELATLALCNGEIHIFSVVDEEPSLVHTVKDVLAGKINTSDEVVDYAGEHAHELPCSKPLWAPEGELLAVPLLAGSVKVLERSTWAQAGEIPHSSDILVDMAHSSSSKHLALLYLDGQIAVTNTGSFQKVSTVTEADSDSLPINLAWMPTSLAIGFSDGQVQVIDYSIPKDVEPRVDSAVEKLFLSEAEDSDNEEPETTNGTKRNGLHESMIIDEYDDFDEDDEDAPPGLHGLQNGYDLPYKRPRLADVSTPQVKFASQRLVPYSPGSTPWVKTVNSNTSATYRRYLFMDSTGFCWSVKNSFAETESQKSVTVSFFDRTVNKDYHFIDHYDYDLCSMNQQGVVFGCSGYDTKNHPNRGRIFYRNHAGTNDSWEKFIPVLEGEYITSICLTTTAIGATGESIIVVGTSLGYTRFFNQYGLCINLMKLNPVISLISSATNIVFTVHQSGTYYTYCIISVSEDYKFLQRDQALPVTASEGPLLKGLFWNDDSDPCMVAGNDDMLVILDQWRESGNARWVPLLSCKQAVSDYGLTESKANWKCWPLGLLGEQFLCLILKTNDIYPGFPLPLPVQLDIKLPVKVIDGVADRLETDAAELETKLQQLKEEDPEEAFLRASTMGRLTAAALNDSEEQDEFMEVLKNYSLAFDKSLLKLFNVACQDSKLNKALSVARLLKNDKALLAATKIAERYSFTNLMTKINKLREDLLEFEADDEE